jgi:hypothetical protein
MHRMVSLPNAVRTNAGERPRWTTPYQKSVCTMLPKQLENAPGFNKIIKTCFIKCLHRYFTI